MTRKFLPACLGLMDAVVESSLKWGEEEKIVFSEPADQHLVPLARAARRWEDKHNVYIPPAPFPPHLSSLHKCQTVGE